MVHLEAYMGRCPNFVSVAVVKPTWGKNSFTWLGCYSLSRGKKRQELKAKQEPGGRN